MSVTQSHMHTLTRALALGLAVAIPAAAPAQSVLDRSPNLSAGWLGARGTLQFNFVHRFGVSSAPLRKVTNSPTFLLSYRLPFPLVFGLNYATSSDIAPAFPNEWELFARTASRMGPLDVAAQVGYNQAARSVDGELTLGRRVGALRVMGVGRVFSNGYAVDEMRWAVGGGATLRITRHIALAGDVAKLAGEVTSLVDPEGSEEIAWGAALQLAIPYSPHTLSLQVTNTNTATLQGASRGLDRVRGGFEFTIPFTLSRYFGSRRKTADDGAAGPAGGATLEMRQMAFWPQRLEITAGTTVAWTNKDPLVHTVTATDGSWDSGDIKPDATWRRTFDRPGTYAFHCTPHPFMTGVVVVR